MPRQFSTDFGNRLEQARIRVIDEENEFSNALSTFEGVTLTLAHQFSELKNYVDQVERDIIAEDDSKFDSNAALLERCGESLSRTERRFKVLLKRRPTIKKLKSTLERIEELNMIADEEVSVQRMETENASDETGRTVVEMVERKISSEVDGGSTMEKVEEFSTDGKLRVAMIEERRSSEIPAGEESEEKLGEVKKSSQALDVIERVAELSFLFEELDEQFGELEVAKNEFSEIVTD